MYTAGPHPVGGRGKKGSVRRLIRNVAASILSTGEEETPANGAKLNKILYETSRWWYDGRRERVNVLPDDYL